MIEERRYIQAVWYSLLYTKQFHIPASSHVYCLSLNINMHISAPFPNMQWHLRNNLEITSSNMHHSLEISKQEWQHVSMHQYVFYCSEGDLGLIVKISFTLSIFFLRYLWAILLMNWKSTRLTVNSFLSDVVTWASYCFILKQIMLTLSHPRYKTVQ